jgi:hypothetical protein
MSYLSQDQGAWGDDGGTCSMCGGSLRSAERRGGRSECFGCRYGDEIGPFVGPVMNPKGDGSYPMDYDAYEGDEAAPPQYMRDLVNASLCRGFCVECKVPMNKAERLASLACQKCVEKLGTDEATGRWDGKPEPSEQEKKEVA